MGIQKREGRDKGGVRVSERAAVSAVHSTPKGDIEVLKLMWRVRIGVD